MSQTLTENILRHRMHGLYLSRGCEVLPKLLDKYFRAYGPAALADASYFFRISKEDTKRLEYIPLDDLCRLVCHGKTYYKTYY